MPRIHEILVLHHSHLDVGYTHGQPVVGEMHREFIDQALSLLADTAGWPAESRPKWTCEVTGPVLRWLESADATDVERFRAFTREGRLSISAMQYNVSALCSAELLARQLTAADRLRKTLDAPIRTAIQHDVNGVAWPLADLLIDAGIELLIMGVNPDHGHPVTPRPGVFLWSAPSGRRLLVMNGNAYTMFDQILRTWDDSLDSMRDGFATYADHLERTGYPHDFLYVTTTSPPEAWDNSPPNPAVAALIRRWNETGADPRIRYVTPEDLLAHLQRIPSPSIPVLRGDWTDYWTFGAGSSSYETAVSREARFSLELAGMLQAGRLGELGRGARPVAERAWTSLALYAEHTWTYWDPDPEQPPTRAQSSIKASFAHEARELGEYLLGAELEALAGNPHQSQRPDNILIVNPTGRARSVTVRVPSAWLQPGKRLRVQRLAPIRRGDRQEPGLAYGRIDLPPFGWKRVSLDRLVRAVPSAEIRVSRESKGRESIESPFHRLDYDSSSGRVTGLLDRRLGWDIIPRTSDIGFFDPVWERPDPSVDGTRRAIYDRDLEKEKLDLPCWKTDWKAERRGPERVVRCTVERDESSASLMREIAGPGLELLRQTITLRADSDAIELEARLSKQDRTDPEATYFAFPLNLAAGWRCHFDTAGVPVELDAEQLPGASRGWMSVDTFIAAHARDRSAALVCPDATLVLPGGFHFGRLLSGVPRPADPLLLAWPLNNYWNTNFPLTQPGVIRLRWTFFSGAAFEAGEVMSRALGTVHPPIIYPSFLGTPRDGQILVTEGNGVVVNAVKRAADGRGIIVRLVNVGGAGSSFRIGPGAAPARSAWLCGTFEDDRQELRVVDGKAELLLEPRLLTLVRLIPRGPSRD